MAVDDFLGRDTEAFVLPTKTYYPVKIPILHYQLRHFISSPEQDLLYYASGSDVYCLNTATKTQAHVTTLPFDARCTASGHGWVCVGGADDGNFAAIKVAGFPPADPADVDSSLPLELTSRLPRPPLLGSAHRIKLEKIGEDIVNSISIHKLDPESEGEDDVVAVLTNNDKTVRIYNLTQNLEVNVLDLPFPMNHATISPDGQLLVAVGDEQQCFFFQRVKMQKPSSLKTPEGRIQSVPPEWFLFEQVPLHTPPTTECRGYFTTAWSPSGTLVAVGSECGYISVFDVELLKTCEFGEDALVRLIKSTRPANGNGPGAVRTMQFSPSPWDLLIWSEDQARVCVADIRSGLKVKQILVLDNQEEGLEKVEVADFDIELSPELRDLRREADFIRRYRRALDSEGNAAAINFATDYIEHSAERRRLHRQLGIVDSDDDPQGLTAHERQIIENLRTTRQREEAREQGTTPRSVSYANGRARSNYNELRSSLREFISDSARELVQERATPRRQPSVVYSTDVNRNNDNEQNGNIIDPVTTRSPNPIPPHARRSDSQSNNAEDAWRLIEEAMAGRSNTDRPSDGSRGPPEIRSDLRRFRQLAQARERLRNPRGGADPSLQPGSYEMPITSHIYRRSAGIRHDPSLGLRTAGLAMSQDGRKLYCGTEQGIFEFTINAQERRSFPAITPR